jgi:hypothetical protein
MEKWFENKEDRYRHREKKEKIGYNDPYKDKLETTRWSLIYKKKRNVLIWGFIWLFIKASLIYIFIKTGIFITLIPLPLIFQLNLLLYILKLDNKFMAP